MSDPYLLTYKDGTRRHISREERDGLLAAAKIKATAPRRYLFLAPIPKFKTFSAYAEYAESIGKPPECGRRWLAGVNFVLELGGKRFRDLGDCGETEVGMAIRINSKQSPSTA